MSGRQLTKAEHAARRKAEREARHRRWREVDRPKMKAEVLTEVERRGLASFMNATRWRALCEAVYNDLPFPPAFELQDVLGPRRSPLDPETVWGHGQWSELEPYFSIEWVHVVPRYKAAVGVLVDPEVIDETAAFRDLLGRLRIPFREDAAETFWIYGYAPADPATLTDFEKEPT